MGVHPLKRPESTHAGSGPETASGLHPGVFLDRDGVLNRSIVQRGKPYAPRRLQDFRLLPGVREALCQLKKAGFLLVVVTNQPDIGNGLIAASEVAVMHDHLRRRVPIDDVRMCPHSQEAGCPCRKPRPGLLLDATAALNIDLGRSYMVGDRASDIMAGIGAGCSTIFIDRRYRETAPSSYSAKVRSLPAAARFILEHASGSRDRR